MMPHEKWLSSILEVAKEAASRDFQEQAWLSGEPSTSSPTEIYNQLFDDFTFDLFYDTYSDTFTPDQATAWREFKKELESYGNKYAEFPNEALVFNDPDWQVVREAASRFVTAFEKGSPHFRQ